MTGDTKGAESPPERTGIHATAARRLGSPFPAAAEAILYRWAVERDTAVSAGEIDQVCAYLRQRASGSRRSPTVASRWTGRSPARWSGRGWSWRPCARLSRHGWSLAVAEDRPARAADRTEVGIPGLLGETERLPDNARPDPWGGPR